MTAPDLTEGASDRLSRLLRPLRRLCRRRRLPRGGGVGGVGNHVDGRLVGDYYTEERKCKIVLGNTVYTQLEHFLITWLTSCDWKKRLLQLCSNDLLFLVKIGYMTLT